MQFFKKYYFVYVFTFAAVCAAALFVSERITYIQAATTQPPAQPVIVIDAGHGGEDGGAISRSGVYESQFNLEIALRLNDLCRLLGFETKMIRESDVAVYSNDAQTISEKKVSDLRNRVKLVNETPGAVLVSVHQNSFPEEKYSGAQVFYADTNDSQALAELLQAKIGTYLDPNNQRQCKRSQMVYLMEHIKCTGILVECGFLTNPKEEAKLKTPSYQKQIACTIGAALSDFLSSYDSDAVISS